MRKLGSATTARILLVVPLCFRSLKVGPAQVQAEWVSIFTKNLAMGTSSHLDPLLRAIVVLAVEWLRLFWMYRNKILIKA